jgi:hypothetical protein
LKLLKKSAKLKLAERVESLIVGREKPSDGRRHARHMKPARTHRGDPHGFRQPIARPHCRDGFAKCADLDEGCHLIEVRVEEANRARRDRDATAIPTVKTAVSPGFRIRSRRLSVTSGQESPKCRKCADPSRDPTSAISASAACGEAEMAVSGEAHGHLP